jgi:hypothetical protein
MAFVRPIVRIFLFRFVFIDIVNASRLSSTVHLRTVFEENMSRHIGRRINISFYFI